MSVIQSMIEKKGKGEIVGCYEVDVNGVCVVDLPER